MPEFTQSWAFAFIVGCFVGGIITFIVTIIMAAGSRGSRAEEKISDKAINDFSTKKGWTKIEIATQGKPEDD